MLSIERLSLADGQRLIEGAERKSVEIGVPMCIAVTDESGNLIAFCRMDGSKVLSVSLSQDKAFTPPYRARAPMNTTKSASPETWPSASILRPAGVSPPSAAA